MTKRERKAILDLERQNLRLAHELEAALKMLRGLPVLPDGAAALIRRGEMVLVGQEDRSDATPRNRAARLAELEHVAELAGWVVHYGDCLRLATAQCAAIPSGRGAEVCVRVEHISGLDFALHRAVNDLRTALEMDN